MGFNNIVKIGYTGSLYQSAQDDDSIRENDIQRTLTFPADGKVIAYNAASALAFARKYIARAGFRKYILPVAGGQELRDVSIGDRFPVNKAKLGLYDYPMEAIEVRRSLSTMETELLLAAIVPRIPVP